MIKNRWFDRYVGCAFYLFDDMTGNNAGEYVFCGEAGYGRNDRTKFIRNKKYLRRCNMNIKKNDKFFAAKENKKSWTISIGEGRVSVSVNVPKDICPTFDDLKAYVAKSDLF